jgi:HPt (histidine-containing phosphotransfer) domain-containing protein
MAQPAIIIGDAAVTIDRGHLARMTSGDRDLEREVLRLFDRQAELLLAHMRSGAHPTAAALAHTLRGSASGVGADNVARAAAAVEQAADESERNAAIDSLALAIDAAHAAIAELLRD